MKMISKRLQQTPCSKHHSHAKLVKPMMICFPKKCLKNKLSVQSVAFSLTGKGYEVVSPDKTQVQEMNEDQSLDLGALLVPIDTGVPKLTTMPIDLV